MSTSVFISSTSRDLLKHRAAVSKSLLQAGFHPIDMADFMARPEGATSACLKEVAEADLFVGIYAWRYGYIPDGAEVSITEQEFLEAEKLKKPCFVFMVDEAYDWPAEFKEGGLASRLLREFKARLDTKLVRTTFTTPEELALKVLASLQRYEREQAEKKAAAEAASSTSARPSVQTGGISISGISGSPINIEGGLMTNVTAGGKVTGGNLQEINTGGGAYIGGGVNTGGGDFTGRDKITTTTTTTITSGVPPESIAEAFTRLQQALEAKPDTMQKEMARQAVATLEVEAQKGPAADEAKVEQGFQVILAMLPDMAEVAIQTFINPIQGLSVAFQKIAQRARQQMKK
jgi:hypothetical protein